MGEQDRIHQCDCGAHGFTVSADAEAGVVYMSSWSYGNAGQKLGWYDRARWCLRILLKGEPFDDQAILTPEVSESLGRSLVSASAEADVNSSSQDGDD